MTEDDPDEPGGADGPDAARTDQEFVPPLDFSSIVFPLYTQALIKLGIFPDPLNPESGVNLELARRLIDLIDLLKDKTKGNLQPEEQKFLETCLQQLRLGYLEKSKTIR